MGGILLIGLLVLFLVRSKEDGYDNGVGRLQVREWQMVIGVGYGGKGEIKKTDEVTARKLIKVGYDED